MVSTYEEYVKKLKDEYSKLSADELIDEFVALHDYITECNLSGDFEEQYKDSVTRCDVVQFIINERLKYFD